MPKDAIVERIEKRLHSRQSSQPLPMARASTKEAAHHLSQWLRQAFFHVHYNVDVIRHNHQRINHNLRMKGMDAGYLLIHGFAQGGALHHCARIDKGKRWPPGRLSGRNHINARLAVIVAKASARIAANRLNAIRVEIHS